MRSVFLIAFFLFMFFGAFAVTSERYYAPYDTRASDNTRYVAPYDPRLKNQNINLDQNQNIAITVYDGNIETLVTLSWTALNSILPWADANVANDITVDWTGLQNYPAACGAGEYVSTVGDTLTCSIPPGITTDTNWETAGKDFKELSELWAYFPYKSVGDANIVSVSWPKITGAPSIPVLVLPWGDANISSSATWNAKLDWSALNGVIPWQDANLSTDFNKTFIKQTDGNTWYVGTGVFNASWPIQDANLSTDFNRVFVRQIDGNNWYVFASTFNSAFPIQDANLSTDLNRVFVRQSDGNSWYVMAGIFNSAFPIQDANLSTDLNRVFVRQSDGNVWYYKVNADVNTTGTVKGVQVCVGNDCQTAWPTGINQTQIDANIYSILNSSVPWADANVADDITLTNITQITNRSYSDLQNLPNIPNNTSIDANIWEILEALLPLTDVNINDVAWGKITGEPDIPTDASIDANIWTILEALLPLTDANITLTALNDLLTTFNSAWPVADANLSAIMQGKPTGAVFTGAWPVQDSNLSTDFNRVFVRQIDGNSWYYKVNNDVNTTGTVKGATLCIGTSCQTSWPSGITQTQLDSNIYAILEAQTPWGDANIDDGITLTNLTQITTRNYSDLSGLPHIPSEATIDANIWDVLEALLPLTDTNINDVAWGKITGEPDFPTEITIDANVWEILEVLLPLTDANINDVAWSKITGEPEIPTDATIDANIWAILEALLPLTDVNINDVAWSKITGEPDFPTEVTIDANVWEILEALLPLTDVNITDVAWSKITGAPEIPVLVLPWADANVDDGITLTNLTQITTRSYSDLQNTPHIPNTATIDSNIYSVLEAQFPLTDSNIGIDINNYVRSSVFNATFPIRDLNIGTDLNATFLKKVDANAQFCTALAFNGLYPIRDANIGTDLNKFVKWTSLPVPWADANISSAVTWNAKPTGAIFNAAFPVADANLSATMQGKPTGAVFNAAFPVADANISSGNLWIKWSYFTGVGAPVPWADANISSAATWNAKPTGAVFTAAFPVADANITAIGWQKISNIPIPFGDANVANDLTIQTTKDLNISTSAKLGVSIEADVNRICFPNDCSGMKLDWNGTALTIS